MQRKTKNSTIPKHLRPGHNPTCLRRWGAFETTETDSEILKKRGIAVNEEYDKTQDLKHSPNARHKAACRMR